MESKKRKVYICYISAKKNAEVLSKHQQTWLLGTFMAITQPKVRLLWEMLV